jgi:hypothetical protein
MTAIFAGNLATHLSGPWSEAARVNAFRSHLRTAFRVSEAEIKSAVYRQTPPETCTGAK